MNTPVESNRTGRRARVLTFAYQCESAIWALLLFTGMFVFPEYPDVSLDPSWRIVLSHAFYHHFQFGPQLVFTHGPLGFLMGNTYDGEHFWPLIGWQLARGAVFTLVILYSAKRLPVIARWIYFTCFILFGVYFEHTLHLAIVLLAGLGELRREQAPKSAACVGLSLGLAFLSAIKFLTLLLAAPTIAIVGIYFWKKTWRKLAIVITGSFITGFLFIWVCAGQELANLPTYLVNSWRTSQSYGDAMAVEPPAGALVKGLGVLTLCVLFLVSHFLLSEKSVRTKVEVLLIGLYAFAVWKHGFLRADGHMGGFFIGMLVLATWLPALHANNERFSGFRWLLAGLLGAASIWGLDQAQTITKTNVWATYREKMTWNIHHVIHWKSFRESYDEETRKILDRLPLRQIRKIVGDASIDVLGYEAAVVCLHRLNYQPRPVFQGYSAYSPELESLNLKYFQSKEAPAFILQKIQTIDGRLMSLDDADLLYVLPALYEFVVGEDGYVLWRRRLETNRLEPGATPAVSTGLQKPNRPLSLAQFSNEPLWMEVDLRYSIKGFFRSFFYQPPIVELQLSDTSGKTSQYRIPLSQARNGFIINPIIEDLASYLHFVGKERTRSVQSVVVATKPDQLKFFGDEFRYSIRKIEQPYPTRSLTGEIKRTTFRFFKSMPDTESAFAPPLETDIDGHPVLLMHAPSEMQYSLPAHPTRISGNFGFIVGAYTQGGGTDGASFDVIWTDNEKSEVLFSRFLDPLHVEADRGLQSFSIDLKDRHGGRLLLKANPGPTGNNGWDWTAWSDLEIR